MTQMVMFDIETSGTKQDVHAIIQIAAIPFDSETIEPNGEPFERKIRFKLSNADPKALEINSYNKEIWDKEAVFPKDALLDFIAFLDKNATAHISNAGKSYQAANLAGHNIAKFDEPWLRAWATRLGKSYIPASYHVIDTRMMANEMSIFRNLDYPNLRLEGLAEYYGLLDEEQSHDALDDVRLNIRVLKALVNEMNGVSNE